MRRYASVLAAIPLAVVLLSAPLLACSSAIGATQPVLGSPSFDKPYSEGWGTARPAKIYNGRDVNGMVKEIQWTSWGGRTAIGYGLEWIFKPGGGYYSRPVLVELRAQDLGHCGTQTAYTELTVRAPAKPEPPLGPWFLWSEARRLCR